MRAMKSTLLCVLLVFCISNLAFGQGAVTAGSLVGDVVDKTGAVLAGAKVTAANKATGFSRDAVTDASGHFSVLQLPPGEYNVTVEQKGFQKSEVAGVKVEVGSTRTLRIALQIGEVSQSIEVSSEAATVETTQSDVGNVIQTSQLRDLPLNQRSFTALVIQQPGLVQIHTQAAPSVLGSATNTGSYISADGSMGSSVAYILDGVNFSNGSQTAPGSAAAGDMPGVEAIQEFKILTHNYSASYGGAAGAVVSFATKSGTNSLHGSVYEFLRNSVFDARNFFDFDETGKPSKPPFRRNQFGAALGGPIAKNKTFFFLNYEGLRQSRTNTVLANVPTICARNGGVGGSCNFPVTIPAWVDPNDFSQGVMQVPVAISPGTRALLDLYPAPTPGLVDFGNGVAQSAFRDKQPTRQDFGLVNFTHAFTARDQFQARYQIVDADAEETPDLPNFLFVRTDRDQNYLLKWTHSISTNLVNTASFSYLRQNIASSTRPLVTLDPLQYTGNVARATIGVMTIGNGSAGTTGGNLAKLGNDDASPFHMVRNIFPFNDDLFYVRGRHSLKFGGMVQRMQWNWKSATITGGSYTFPTVNDLLAGNPSFVLIHRDGPDSDFHIRTTVIAWYFEDSWRVSNRLTFNYGLRHDFQVPIMTDTENRLGNWQRPTDTQIHVGEPYNNYSFKQFQPRVGLAWDPFGQGRTVVRAGYGLFNDFVDFAGNAQGQLQWNAPQPVLNSYLGLSLLPSFPIFPQLEFPSCAACTVPGPFPGLITGILLPMHSPTSQQWNIGLEHELPGRFSLALNYTGSQSYHIPRKLEQNYNQPCGGDANPLLDSNGLPVFSANGINCAPQPTGAPGIQGIGFSLYSKRYDTNANYNGLSVKLSRAVGSLTFQTAYTWAHAISESDAVNSNNIITGVAMASIYPANFRLDRSESAFSRRHRFTENVSWDIPFGRGRRYMNTKGAADVLLGGWTISSLGTFQTGQPFSVLVGSDITGGGDAIDFPYRPDQSGPARINGGIAQYFDPSVFTLPSPGHIGTASRTPLVGPGFSVLDMSVHKMFNFTERVNLRFRADLFNVLNHPNFSLPFSQLFQPDGSRNPLAGSISSTVRGGLGSREIQFSLKLNF